MALSPNPDARVSRERVPAAELRRSTAVYQLVRSADGRYRIAENDDDGVASASLNASTDGRLRVNEPPAPGAVPIVRLGATGLFIF